MTVASFNLLIKGDTRHYTVNIQNGYKNVEQVQEDADITMIPAPIVQALHQQPLRIRSFCMNDTLQAEFVACFVNEAFTLKKTVRYSIPPDNVACIERFIADHYDQVRTQNGVVLAKTSYLPRYQRYMPLMAVLYQSLQSCVLLDHPDILFHASTYQHAPVPSSIEEIDLIL